MSGVVFIGNFVNDVIVKVVGTEERISKATGGSVTYGSLAAVSFGCSPPPQIISKAGNDLSPEFLTALKSKGVKLDSVEIAEGKKHFLQASLRRNESPHSFLERKRLHNSFK